MRTYALAAALSSALTSLSMSANAILIETDNVLPIKNTITSKQMIIERSVDVAASTVIDDLFSSNDMSALMNFSHSNYFSAPTAVLHSPQQSVQQADTDWSQTNSAARRHGITGSMNSSLFSRILPIESRTGHAAPGQTDQQKVTDKKTGSGVTLREFMIAKTPALKGSSQGTMSALAPTVPQESSDVAVVAQNALSVPSSQVGTDVGDVGPIFTDELDSVVNEVSNSVVSEVNNVVQSANTSDVKQVNSPIKQAPVLPTQSNLLNEAPLISQPQNEAPVISGPQVITQNAPLRDPVGVISGLTPSSQDALDSLTVEPMITVPESDTLLGANDVTTPSGPAFFDENNNRQASAEVAAVNVNEPSSILLMSLFLSAMVVVSKMMGSREPELKQSRTA
ncbi:hypothetical protein [Alteromonas oceanisediminis]|uniref:hypothetical protein n=1 Tax=Alteromonas oceanisediminis TaxID=2836180 RepID=UPI001BDAF496|nr:hypothetical protein [Alteromonas oceanisediminis]MBT0585134.1 hypothetical protein [Alteromonas oceanisediminis]